MKLTPELKKLLLNLPVNTWDKISLFLVLGNYKQGSEIFVSKWHYDREKKAVWISDRTVKRIDSFLDRVGLKYEMVRRNTKIRVRKGELVEVDEPVFCFSYDNKIAIKLARMFQSKGCVRGIENLELGLIYGFPTEAVKAYVRMQNGDKRSDELEKMSEFEKVYGRKKWAAYATYIARKNHPEDYKIAKKWYRYIAKEMPELDARIQEIQTNWIKREKISRYNQKRQLEINPTALKAK